MIKRAYKYRVNPTPEKAYLLNRTFGCVRLVWNNDAGPTHLVTLSTGEKIANPGHERSDRRKLARACEVSSRKAEGSVHRDKARQRVARIHARITDRRSDHLRKPSTRLVRENQALAIKGLTVRNMLNAVMNVLAVGVADK